MNEFMNLSSLIRQEKPKIEDLLRCEDVVSMYKMKNKELNQLIVSKKGLLEIIDVFLRTQDAYIISNISKLFTSTNTALLKFFSEDLEFSEKLFSFLEKEEASFQQKVIAATMAISSAFNYWPQEMAKVFEQSTKDIPLLTQHIEDLAVFSLFSSCLLRNTGQESFSWYLFLCIMDKHGPGAIKPFHIRWEYKEFTILSSAQRCKVLDLLSQYIKCFPDETDFIKIVTTALPLMLTDSSSEYELSLVFKLALAVEFNSAVAKSAISFVGSLPSASPLYLYTLKYLAKFNVKLENDDVLVLLYRFFKLNSHNNLIMNAIIKIVESSSKDNEELQNYVKQLLFFMYKRIPMFQTSYLMRSFKFSIMGVLDGQDVDPLSENFAMRIKDNKDLLPSVNVDNSLISSIVRKASIKKRPVFEARELWGRDCQCISCSFPTVDRLEHLAKLQRKKPKQSRSRSPDATYERSEKSPRSSHDDSDLPAKKIKFPREHKIADFKPKKGNGDSIRENNAKPAHKRTYSAEVDIRDLNIDGKSIISGPFLTKNTINSFKRQSNNIITEESENNKAKQSVKAPQVPPQQLAPHRAAPVSPHTKKRPSDETSPSPPPTIIQVTVPQPVRPTLQMCTLDSFEYMFDENEKKDSDTQTEIFTETKAVMTEKKTVKLTIDVFDPLNTNVKESMPQLQQRERRIDNDGTKQGQNQQQKIIIKLQPGGMKQKKYLVNEEQMEGMYPRSPPQRPQFLQPLDDQQGQQQNMMIKPKSYKAKITRKSMWDDLKNDRGPRYAPPIVPKPTNHNDFSNYV